MRIVRFLIADPHVNISVPLTDILKHSFSSIEHRIQKVLSSVEVFLPLVLERHCSIRPMWFCLKSMSEGLTLESTGGVDGLNGEFVGSLEWMGSGVGLDDLA